MNSDFSKRKGRKCACPRNRLDNLILTQDDAVSILRIIQLTAANLPIPDEDRQFALGLYQKQCRVFEWLYDRSIKEMTDPTPDPLT